MKTIERLHRELLAGQLEQARRKVGYYDALTLAVVERLGPDSEGAEVTDADEARAMAIFEQCYRSE